jgi:hypothetical protein
VDSPNTDKNFREPRAIACDLKGAAQSQFVTDDRFGMRFHAAFMAETTSYWQGLATKSGCLEFIVAVRGPCHANVQRPQATAAVRRRRSAARVPDGIPSKEAG